MDKNFEINDLKQKLFRGGKYRVTIYNERKLPYVEIASLLWMECPGRNYGSPKLSCVNWNYLIPLFDSHFR